MTDHVINDITVTVTLTIRPSIDVTVEQLQQVLLKRGEKVADLPTSDDVDEWNEYAHDLLSTYYNHNDTIEADLARGNIDIEEITIDEAEVDMPEPETTAD